MDLYYALLGTVSIFASVVIPVYVKRENRGAGDVFCAISMCGLIAISGATYLGAAVAEGIVKHSLITLGDLNTWLEGTILLIALLRAKKSREVVNGLIVGFVWRTNFVRLR